MLNEFKSSLRSGYVLGGRASRDQAAIELAAIFMRKAWEEEENWRAGFHMAPEIEFASSARNRIFHLHTRPLATQANVFVPKV